MKKTILTLFMLVSLFLLAACGNNNDAKKEEETGTDDKTKTEENAVVEPSGEEFTVGVSSC